MTTVSASVGEVVTLQFSVFDVVDGTTRVSGYVDGDFNKGLFVNGIASAEVVTVAEISGGRYSASFTPTSNGVWYLEVDDPEETTWAMYVEVGPPPDDVVESIADAVWSEPLPGTFADDTAGGRLFGLSLALLAARLTVEAGSTTTVVNTDATQLDGFYDGLQVVVANSEGTVARLVTGYLNADGAFTLDTDLPFIPDVGDSFIVMGALGSLAISANSDVAVKLCEVHQLLGLNPEAPLCVSKTQQVAGDITLKHSEVGGTVTVKRE